MAKHKASRAAASRAPAARRASEPASGPATIHRPTLYRPLAAGMLAFGLHLPFVLRYDLHFQPDFAISVMISRAVLQGERPIFFWGQAYLGTYGNYLTAIVFHLLGVSVTAAALVSLAVWASGVALVTRLAEWLLGGRAASWTAVVAAVASPYANHYATQPYSGYETAPVLTVMVLFAVLWVGRLVEAPFGLRAAASWLGLGLVLGVGWWTTRLFLPAVAAAGLAVLAARPAWLRRLPRALPGTALLLAGFLLGASPDLMYRLGYVAHETRGSVASPLFELAVAPLSEVPANVAQALRALPAYFNGDPRARLPEGITFITALANDEDPYADPAFAPGTLARLGDGVAAGAVAALLALAARLAVQAWRARNGALLALAVEPFAHLAFIGLSGRTGGGYFEARRYWYASLLVFPALAGHAIARGEAARSAAARAGVRALAGILLAASLGAQARMLELPDELAAERTLVEALEARGERAVLMPQGSAWIVAALSGGRIEAVGTDGRRPDLVDRLAAKEHITVALPAGRQIRGGKIRLSGRSFVQAGSARRVAEWDVFPFDAMAVPE